MDIRKFSQLHDLIINEDVAQARELFHEIVVEKSREIFESIMADDMEEDDMEEGKMGGQVGDLLDEINAEESGVMEDDDDADIDFDDDAEDAGADLTHDMEMDHDEEGEAAEHEEIEDAVIRIEDKLDQLMAEFEEIMGGGDEDFGDEEGAEDFGDEEGAEDFGDEDDEEAMMEAVQLQKVSVTHGDNGVQTKSAVGSAANAGQAGMASKPVKFAGDTESAPNGPKGPSNAYSKGEGNLPGAGSFKNSPGKGNFKEKGESTPKPVTKDGAAYDRSPVAESRRSARRPIR
jgi:hypothetical protein